MLILKAPKRPFAVTKEDGNAVSKQVVDRRTDSVSRADTGPASDRHDVGRGRVAMRHSWNRRGGRTKIDLHAQHAGSRVTSQPV